MWRRWALEEYIKVPVVTPIGRAWPSKRHKSVLVYRSNSNDPFVNLAFEDWIHENVDHDNKSILYLWRNKPTVVIGRHQNPWKECNLELLKSLGINLVRRKSGGGTVYHDLGNINCTFFTDRESYNRKRNLEFLANFLRKTYGFDVSVNNRDDMVLESRYKISGTAAKLSLKKAYHHCTLLCQVDTDKLDAVLTPSYTGIDSNATKSLKSKTKNLFDGCTTFDWEKVTRKLATAFLKQNQSDHNSLKVNESLHEVDPLSTGHSPEIMKKKYQLSDWDWNFGKTPRFCYEIAENFPFGRTRLKMTINKGTIAHIDVECSIIKNDAIISKVTEQLNGIRFDRSDVLLTLSHFLATACHHSSQEEDIFKEISEWITGLFH